ncbi:serine/arginine-rich splicing factor 7 isoform X3 [Peromyscus maniculatus bairdii]|uniref:serine/arginine-rich splicing factor 7 isoform X3 n=1 Tax=Peromyscus maniculatus bairdii TaxID=230844 RepID=UPI003FD67E57
MCVRRRPRALGGRAGPSGGGPRRAAGGTRWPLRGCPSRHGRPLACPPAAAAAASFPPHPPPSAAAAAILSTLDERGGAFPQRFSRHWSRGVGGEAAAGRREPGLEDLEARAKRAGGRRGVAPATETKVYVGNLGTGAGKGELERAFSYYGPLRTVWIARNPPGFAFVEFEDPRDAEDAVRGLDGKVICGSRVRVELSTGMPRRSRFDRPPARRPFDPNDRCYECGEKGHYAYDCHRYSRRRRSRSRSRSHSRSRGRRYSRSRSRSRGRRSRSASPRRSRSVSLRRSRSASLRRSRSGSIKGSRYFQSRSRSRSRSRSISRPRSSRSPSGSPRRSASPERMD